jgi:hypothetical protein
MNPSSPRTHTPSEPRKFGNGTWSCCARSHSRPADASPLIKASYEALYPHVSEWEEDVPDVTTEILFGISASPSRITQ